MSWTEGPISGTDLETTGIDVRTDRIVQWCVVDTLPGCEPVAYQEIVNPGVPIPPEATRVHGLTDEHVQAHGNPARESIARYAEEISRRLLARMPIGGMNLAYDLTLLRYECLRHDIQPPQDRAGHSLAPVLDAYVLDKHVDPYRKGSRRLDDSKGPGIATHYGVTLVGAHDAVPDTIAAVEVIRIIGRRYIEEIGSMGLFRLHALQAEWRAEQCVSLQRHLRRAKPGVVVDPCWPQCTDDTHIRD